MTMRREGEWKRKPREVSKMGENTGSDKRKMGETKKKK